MENAAEMRMSSADDDDDDDDNECWENDCRTN